MTAVLPINAERIADDRKRAMEWFCRYLWDKTGVDVRAGVTTPAQREANIRKVIAERGLADKVLGRFNDRSEDHRQFCKRALGVDL